MNPYQPPYHQGPPGHGPPGHGPPGHGPPGGGPPFYPPPMFGKYQGGPPMMHHHPPPGMFPPGHFPPMPPPPGMHPGGMMMHPDRQGVISSERDVGRDSGREGGRAPLLPLPAPTREIHNSQLMSIYVGKIPETLDDGFIRKLIGLCGKVVKWNRASDTSGKLKGFGFCEYDSPEGVLRALRLLNNLQLDDKNILVKADDKVQKLLNDYVEQRNQEQHEAATAKGIVSENGTEQSEEAKLSETQEDDRVKETIQQLIESIQPEIDERRRQRENKPVEPVNNEPKTFDLRLMTKEEKIRMAAKEKEREIERERDRDQRRKERYEREFKDKERDWEAREAKYERERDREKERELERERNELNIRRQEMEEYNSDDERMKKRLKSHQEIKRRQKEREEDLRDRERDVEAARMKMVASNGAGVAGGSGSGLTAETINKIQIDFSAKRAARLNVASGFNTQAEEPELAAKKKEFILLDYNEIVNIEEPQETQQQQPPTIYQQHLQYQQQQQLQMQQQQLQQQQQAIAFNKHVQDTKALAAAAASNTPKPKSKEEVQKIIDSIPADKEALLSLKMGWDTIERLNIVDNKMKPWIAKKLTDIIGVEEVALVDHITTQLKARVESNALITQLHEMIDEEAESFVLKMWRMLAFYEKSAL
ncbi:hypothetical protein SAMD00019534_104950 [Acytostelium subglobosum LB1]|uniref:hypothetical protein n=1 Tax=Acytostelium subglobosum LB1 TaxID=1410327 RepID=UPI0006450002|nr:hypothetical protein SAMD00019534_104950 [Acytostelium subglobosum LB1]GAM27320.1 hypothetical protein SAMD00019534_104950 [Acytostelium subglobosum LB1]|eukprot:XP_012749787.1 hypothetical protein SAMD00019534_104950 [Acytostelium subglobosum LB1]